jgi:hypothetical protein
MVGRGGRPRVAPHVDLALGEQPADPAAGLPAEHRKWLWFVGDERDVEVGDPVGRGVGGGHQRELVERQGPRDARGKREGDRANLAALDLAKQRAQRCHVVTTAEGQRTGDRGDRASSRRDEQGVIPKLGPSAV